MFVRTWMAGSVAVLLLLLGQAVTGPGASAAARAWTVPAAAYGEASALNVPVTMSDGTVLRADVYFPTAAPGSETPAVGRFPVLLQQTPYGKQNVYQAGAGAGTDVPSLVGQGYIVVIADVRGTGTSGGTWGLLDPVQGTDGATLALWAADELCGARYGRPGSDGISRVLPAGVLPDGEVGLFGESYMGINEFLTVEGMSTVLPAVRACDNGARDPVRAMFPIIAGNDLYRDFVTQGGLFNAEFGPTYVALVNSLSEADPLFDPFEEQYIATQQGGARPTLLQQELTSFLPTALAHSGSVAGYDVPALANIETGGNQIFDQHEGFGQRGYWPKRNPVNVLAQVVRERIATFLVGGWHDVFQRGELMNYVGLQNEWYDQFRGGHRGITAPMAPGQPVSPRYQLLMGPWYHVTAGSGSSLADLEIEWFDSWLGGPGHERGAQSPTPLQTTARPLHLYELGSGSWNDQQHTGAWYDTADWPVASDEVPGATGGGYAATRLYFGPARRPGTSSAPALSDNQGTLTTMRPVAGGGADMVAFTGVSSPCSLSSDQASAGGPAEGEALGGSSLAWPCTSNDATTEAGPGSLTYTSSPLSTGEALIGPIDATVFATSTAPDTELVATIERVSPSGQPQPLTTGALLGELRGLDTARTDAWDAADGAPLAPFHPYTRASVRGVVPGKVTEYQLEVFPTFAEIPAGWRLRVTITTSDTPHVLPTAAQLPGLLGGVYRVQRNSSHASFLNLPLVPASTLAQPAFRACNQQLSTICMPAGAAP